MSLEQYIAQDSLLCRQPYVLGKDMVIFLSGLRDNGHVALDDSTVSLLRVAPALPRPVRQISWMTLANQGNFRQVRGTLVPRHEEGGRNSGIVFDSLLTRSEYGGTDLLRRNRHM